jgi:hypothetical protein
VGAVDLLLVAVDNGPDRTMYAGPVFSHYEFDLPGTTRLSDSEWRKELRAGQTRPRPPWTRGYLVPGRGAGVRGIDPADWSGRD